VTTASLGPPARLVVHVLRVDHREVCVTVACRIRIEVLAALQLLRTPCSLTTSCTISVGLTRSVGIFKASSSVSAGKGSCKPSGNGGAGGSGAAISIPSLPDGPASSPAAAGRVGSPRSSRTTGIRITRDREVRLLTGTRTWTSDSPKLEATRFRSPRAEAGKTVVDGQGVRANDTR
jgi:hypothetical protein